VNSPSSSYVYLWEPTTGRPLGNIGDGKWGAIQGFSISPQGRLLATAEEKGNQVRLWDLVSGKEMACFQGHSGSVFCVAFSPNGKQLATGGADGTILLWDISNWNQSVPNYRGGLQEIENLWDQLNEKEGPGILRTVWTLVDAGENAVKMIRAKVKPILAPGEKRIKSLLGDLDHDTFNVRSAAATELAKVGQAAEPFLRKALEAGGSAEFRRQVEGLLANCQNPALTEEEVRNLRAIWVLEEIGTPGAQECLKTLASGALAARLTREARGALERLQRRGTR
jgi:hypothetical protein